MLLPDSNVAVELRALAARLLALADRMEADPAAAQRPRACQAMMHQVASRPSSTGPAASGA